MFRKMLLPLDGSELAESIVPQALRFLKVEDADVVLLRVVHAVGVERTDPEGIIGKAEEEATSYLGRIAEILAGLHVPCQTLVRRGAPASTILRVAKEERAELIALSTRGRSTVGRMLFGSVAERIRLHSPVPVLLLRPEPSAVDGWREVMHEGFGRVLTPLDGSGLAEEALPIAAEIARVFDGRVFAMRAYTPPPMMGLDTDEVNREMKIEAEQYIEEVLPRLGDRGESLVERGVPADAILEAVQRHRLDLVVMTTHGRTGFDRFLMGSVADRVVRGLTVPVLLVRSEAAEPGRR